MARPTSLRGVNKAALVLEHAEMAKGIALGYGQERNLDQAVRDELVQEAYLALAKAAESWDPLRGPFAQWARMRVGFHLLDVSRKDAPLTRGEHARGAKPPRIVELLEEFVEGEEDDALPDEIATLLDGLPLRERRLLEFRYTDGLTQEETAARMELSPARVSQLEKRALSKLRDQLERPGEWPVIKVKHSKRKLTKRQTECLLLGARGLSVEETARVMGVHPNVVRGMRRAAATRLGAKGLHFMANLVYIAVREGHIT